MERLREKLRRIDGRGYKAYKTIAGTYRFEGFELLIDHVQGDPFAAPSRLRVRVPQDIAGFPRDSLAGKSRKTALEDFLTRRFGEAIERTAKGRRGSGRSGAVGIIPCGQEILERSSTIVRDECVEVRFVVGLPARGRTILGREAETILFEEVPLIVERSLRYGDLDRDRLWAHVKLAEDQDFIRRSLPEKGLVAFLANVSILPRRSGVDDRPMDRDRAVPLFSPPSLETSFDTPNSGIITGMGIPRGVTLIVGGGYHGKSTLLRAVERGVYNQIPEDGREFVITNPHAVKIRAEDGRRVEKVDISDFITNLPAGKSTEAFSSDEASGSTSQAANIVEALELGAELLLIDEDTSATNFMIRDHRMQRLVRKEKEPITPFVDRVQALYRGRGVSTILVLGGSGDYLDVADLVIMLDEYRPRNVTSQAKKVARQVKTGRKREGTERKYRPRPRAPLSGSFDPRRGKKAVKIDAKRIDTIFYGYEELDLSYVEQLVDLGQTRAIGDAIHYAAKHYVDGRRTLKEIVDLVMRDIDHGGLDVVNPFERVPFGGYVAFRRHELGAAINRLRSLAVKSGR
jgi:predicted ABC-class ATPase